MTKNVEKKKSNPLNYPYIKKNLILKANQAKWLEEFGKKNGYKSASEFLRAIIYDYSGIG